MCNESERTADVRANAPMCTLPVSTSTKAPMCYPTKDKVDESPKAPMCNTENLSGGSKLKTTAEIVAKPGQWKPIVQTEEWKMAQRKRLRNKLVVPTKGKADTKPEGKFKAAHSNVPLFVSNIDKQSSDTDIKEHIFERTQLEVLVKKINMKSEKGYSAYKILVPSSKLDVFMDENFWPAGILFRPFVEYKQNKKDDSGVPTVLAPAAQLQ